jgi:hypothetical protein
LMQNWLMFSIGMGLNIFGVGIYFLDIMLLGGIWRFIG